MVTILLSSLVLVQSLVKKYLQITFFFDGENISKWFKILANEETG